METPASLIEEECLNVYWKIKNFSFCCEKIESPQLSRKQYWLMLNSRTVDVECKLECFPPFPQNLIGEISFLTCDGSPEESVSVGAGVHLRVPKDVIFGKRRNSFLPEDTLTIRFRYLTESERGKIYICSQIGVKRIYSLWTIQNFSNRLLTSEKPIEKSKSYGYIKLTLKPVVGVNTGEQFCIEISRTNGDKCYCILKVSVLDVDGKAVNEVSDEFVFEKKNDRHTRVLPTFFKKSEFIACKNLLLPEDTLSLKCNFAVSSGSLEDPTDVVSYNEDVKPFMNESDDLSILRHFNEKKDSGSVLELQTDLKSSLDDGPLFDVSLRIGSDVIQAHKHILSARSPVFRAMFTKDMKEAVDNTVNIEDLDVETVRELLLYLYTDTIHDKKWESMKKLYYAADKYGVASLKEKCISFLKTSLSISNVCEALLFADLHQDANLKTAAVEFITEYDSAVLASDAWKEIEKRNSSLAIRVLRKICNRKKFKSN